MRDLADDRRPRSATLEGRALRISDRVAYVNHDVDDAVRAGLITQADLPLDLLAELGSTHSERIANMVCDIVEFSEGKAEVDMSPRMSAATDRLKQFLLDRVYLPEKAPDSELAKAQRVVLDLYRFYMEHPEKMTGDRRLLEAEPAARAKAVCDFVAGMTDRFALTRFVRHFLRAAFGWIRNTETTGTPPVPVRTDGVPLPSRPVPSCQWEATP